MCEKKKRTKFWTLRNSIFCNAPVWISFIRRVRTLCLLVASSYEVQGSRTTMKLNQICRLCLCTQKPLLPLYDSAENLLEKIHSISSRVEVRCSSEALLCFTPKCLLTYWILTYLKLLIFTHFKNIIIKYIESL